MPPSPKPAAPKPTASKPAASRPQPLWRRTVRLHKRLFLAIVLALLVYAALPAIAFRTRFLVAWDVGTAFWLILIFFILKGGTAERVKQRAAEEDEGAAVILIVALLASLLSIVAVVQEAGSASGGPTTTFQHVLLAIGTLALSWSFIHGMYAMHYAREYYSSVPDSRPMLGFPGDASPDFWDFFYFSFTIGTSAQTADVSVNSQRMRRMVLGHQLVSYAFNASVLALGVNVAASLI